MLRISGNARLLITVALCALLLPLTLPLAGFARAPFAPNDDWLQWGGTRRDFKPASKGLASSWGEKGPKQLWSRTLGEGHSAILAEGNRLYTMYGSGERETVIALDAATGKTIWEQGYNAPPAAGANYEFGKGPHATPLLVGQWLYTIGTTAKLHCLDKQTGKILWAHDLWQEFKGTFVDVGYAVSPIAYKNTIIVTVGGDGLNQSLIAFNQRDGSVVWKRQNLVTSPSSHVIINVAEQEQLVAFLGDTIAGIDPNNGELLWSYPHKTDYNLNICTPVWGEDNLLFLSSAYSGGSRVLRLERAAGKTTATEVWFHRRLRIHHGNAIRIGDTVYGSSGDFGPAFLCAVDVKTGNVLFQDRSFAKATLLYADGKFIILDEDGHLALATMSPAGIKVLARASIFNSRSWTVPTLVGTKLYARDRKSIIALDLG